MLNVDFPVGHSQARYRFNCYDNPKCLPVVAVPPAIFSTWPRTNKIR